ncbi:hypothetical protein ACFTY8_47520 [Streptomyces mirabilis]|uniref:hypothetical protein n=1 Tax=Streptomyces mirabilis TaxID=68239 RepID=UPI003643B292
MQTHFHEHAIAATNGRSRSHDQRLLLLRDADVLVGAAIHYSEEGPSDGSGGTFERRLDAYAIALDAQGQKLSTGEHASKALLRAVVSDITTRHSPRDTVILTALVHPENAPSRKCLERYGWTEEDRQDPYLLYAITLAKAQNALDVEPGPDLDAFHEPGA